MEEWVAIVAIISVLAAALGVILLFKLFRACSAENRIFSKTADHSEIKSFRKRCENKR
jgi:hypothetical protein